jgi:hypothetical protein
MQVEAATVVVPAVGEDKAEKPEDVPAPAISDEEAAKIKEREKEEAAFHKRLLTVPEAEVFVQLLVTIYLLDQKALDASISCASSLIQRAQTFNRRCDPALRLNFFEIDEVFQDSGSTFVKGIFLLG